MASFEEFRVSVRANPSRFGMLGALVVFAVYLLNYQGPGAIPSDARMLVTGLLLAQRPVEVVDPGGRAWRVEPAPRTPDAALSLGHGTAATGDLCIGAAMILAPALRLAGPLAAHIAYALLPALLSLLVYGTATRVFGRRWLAFVAQLLVALNPFMLSFQGLHPAFFSAPLGAAVMFLLVGPPRHRVLLGMLFGALVAVENASLLLAAPILVMLATEGGEPLALRLGGLLRVVAAALLVLAPALWWKELAFGSMLMHPREALPASALRFPHGVFHWTWEQAALLNYPLGPEVVRTPHFPFPGFLGLPLALARGFGLLLASCFFLGAGPLLREDRRLARFLLSWVVLFYLWWGFQEDWDESRTAGVLIAVPAVVLLM
ncbi:MAG: hypothetical protein FJ098_09090, partial [Deltaproteobacteria bacterium]|nr:hypothetical protein [Deltaproteobacteria bacterium]